MVDQARIQKLIDCLGDGDTPVDAIDPEQKYKAIVAIHSSRNTAKTDMRIGLHYSGAHWYARKPDSSGSDGYTARYQPRNSAHFCQTFAAMIFTGRDAVLKADDYATNIEKAMDFWLGYLADIRRQKKEMRDWFIGRLRETDPTLGLNEFENLLLYARGSAGVIFTWG